MTTTTTPTTTTTLVTKLRRVLAIIAPAALAIGAPAAAMAQEFVKVDGKIADNIPAVPFVGIAYGFIWIAVLGYVIVVARGLNRVRGEVEGLRRKLDGAVAVAGAGAAREAERK